MARVKVAKCALLALCSSAVCGMIGSTSASPLAAGAITQQFMKNGGQSPIVAVDYVNTLIGSGGANGLGGWGNAQLNPGAQYPFGMLRLGPDTTGTASLSLSPSLSLSLSRWRCGGVDEWR